MTQLLSPPRRDALTHQALLYDSSEQFVAATVPFLREGVRQGQATRMVSSSDNIGAVREVLDADEADAITFEESTRRYSHAARALAAYQRLLFDLAGAGRAVRVVSEPVFATIPVDQHAELCRGDAAFNGVCPVPDVAMICPYNLRSTPPAIVRAIRRSHPEIVEAGARLPSPAYTEPTVLLSEERQGPPLPGPSSPVAALASPRDPAEVRTFVRKTIDGSGIEGVSLHDFVMAVNEIVTNAFTHALIDVVRVWREPDRVLCEVRDYGPGLTDPLAGYRYPRRPSRSGWGLWLARQLVDLVEIRTGVSGSTVRLHARTASPPA